jgi:DNA primase
MHVTKPDVDVRGLVERDLGRPAYHSGKAAKYKCPFHQEHHGFSLAVYADGWRCFGKCVGTPTERGDALDWLRHFQHLTFAEACQALQARVEDTDPVGKRQPVSHPESVEPPDTAWQRRGSEFMSVAQHTLWQPQGQRALDYLCKRGLSDETIRASALGYWPGQPDQWRRYGSLAVPCGIVILWRGVGALWSLKVRRAVGEPKYLAVKGSTNKGLYGVDGCKAGQIALLVEGEFDALVAAQECGDWLCALTLGAASNRLSQRWRSQLLGCQHVLVATDNDAAGTGAADHLLALLPNAQRLKLPDGVKDLNALHLSGAGAVRRYLQTYRC